MIDIWLKLTGTEAQARQFLHSLGLDRAMLARDEDGNEFIGSVYNHDVAVNFVPNLVTKFATYDNEGNELTPAEFDGPHLMVRFLSEDVKKIAREKIVDVSELPEKMGKAAVPVTLKWAGD